MDIELEEVVVTSKVENDWWKSIKESRTKVIDITKEVGNKPCHYGWADKSKLLVYYYEDRDMKISLVDVTTGKVDPQIVLNCVRDLNINSISDGQMYTTAGHGKLDILRYDFSTQSLHGVVQGSKFIIPEENRQRMKELSIQYSDYYHFICHISGYILLSSFFGGEVLSYSLAEGTLKQLCRINFNHFAANMRLGEFDQDEEPECYCAPRVKLSGNYTPKCQFALIVTTNKTNSTYNFRKFCPKTNSMSAKVSVNLPVIPKKSYRVVLLEKHVILQHFLKQNEFTLDLVSLTDFSILDHYKFTGNSSSRIQNYHQMPIRVRQTEFLILDIVFDRQSLIYKMIAVRNNRLHRVKVACTLPITSYIKSIDIVSAYHDKIIVKLFNSKTSASATYCVQFN